jgi:hypothetical protein
MSQEMSYLESCRAFCREILKLSKPKFQHKKTWINCEYTTRQKIVQACEDAGISIHESVYRLNPWCCPCLIWDKVFEQLRATTHLKSQIPILPWTKGEDFLRKLKKQMGV